MLPGIGALTCAVAVPAPNVDGCGALAGAPTGSLAGIGIGSMLTW
jgi:hypothetical protein